jgi:hypothetical protein
VRQREAWLALIAAASVTVGWTKQEIRTAVRQEASKAVDAGAAVKSE